MRDRLKGRVRLKGGVGLGFGSESVVQTIVRALDLFCSYKGWLSTVTLLSIRGGAEVRVARRCS